MLEKTTEQSLLGRNLSFNAKCHRDSARLLVFCYDITPILFSSLSRNQGVNTGALVMRLSPKCVDAEATLRRLFAFSDNENNIMPPFRRSVSRDQSGQ